MIDPLEIGNVGTVPENLRHVHIVISTEQESQGYQGSQQIQGKRQPKMTENAPKRVIIEKIKSRQSGYKTLYPDVKFQSAIYPSWSNANDLNAIFQSCSQKRCS